MQQERILTELPLSNRQVGLLVRRGLGVVSHRETPSTHSGATYGMSLPEGWEAADIKRHDKKGYTRTIINRLEQVVGFTHIEHGKWRFKLHER